MTSTPNLYPVHLDPTQRESLQEITRNGRAPVKMVRHAQVLLLSDRDRPGGKRTDEQIADALGMHVNTVARVRKRFVTEGVRPALERKPRRSPPRSTAACRRISSPSAPSRRLPGEPAGRWDCSPANWSGRG